MNLHIGSGPIHLPGFTNIDKEAFHNPDVVMDCLDLRMKYGKNVADIIYSCHHIEHLKYPTDSNYFLKVCHDVLKPGGVLRLVVPDLMRVAGKYVAGQDLKDIYNGNFFYHIDCPAERFMYFCREWEHKILLDEQLLTQLLKDAGFEKIKWCVFGQSDTPELRGLDRFESESMVLESTK